MMALPDQKLNPNQSTMFKKLFGGINNHLNKVTANSVLNTYCFTLERMIQYYESGESDAGNLKKGLETAGLMVAVTTVAGMPPKSIYQQTIANNLEKVFQDCAGVTDPEVLEAISNHVWYACSRQQNAIDSKRDCFNNLNLSDCLNYNRFCSLRTKASRLANAK